ncbi:MAG: MFS transporter [Deltaproteobacteria bacterium]|nr:MFS transporter [Deltaproteobacteria bacterium]
MKFYPQFIRRHFKIRFHTPQFIKRHRNWCLFSIMTAATLISCFQQVGLATVSADVAASLQVGPARLGLLTASFFYAYAFMQIPAGLLSDTLGPRKSVTIALLLATVGTFIFALCDSMTWAVISRAIMGVGLAVIVVPLLKLTIVWFPASAFPRLTAIAFGLGSLGPLLATSPMAYAAAVFGWRPPFIFLALVTLVSAWLIWQIVRDAPDKISELVNTSGSGQGVSNQTMREANVPSGRELMVKLGQIMRNRDVWILGIWNFFQGGIYFAFVGLWGGQYLTAGFGMEATEAGWCLSLAACALLFGPLITWLYEKLGSARKTLIILSVCSITLLLPMVFGLPRLSSPVLTIYFLFLCIAATAGAAVLFCAAKEHFDVSLAGTVSGFINMFSFAGGAIFQQVIGLSVKHLEMGGADSFTAISDSFGFFLGGALFSLILAWKYRSAAEVAASK